jgi:hypothetical protein
MRRVCKQTKRKDRNRTSNYTQTNIKNRQYIEEFKCSKYIKANQLSNINALVLTF